MKAKLLILKSKMKAYLNSHLISLTTLTKNSENNSKKNKKLKPKRNWKPHLHFPQKLIKIRKKEKRMTKRKPKKEEQREELRKQVKEVKSKTLIQC